MLKIHSFLQRALKPIKASIPLSGNNKAGIAAAALYIAVICFLLLSPDTIHEHTLVQNSPIYTAGNAAAEESRIEEETAIEASGLQAYGTQSVNPYVFFRKNIAFSSAGNDSSNIKLANTPDERVISTFRLAEEKKLTELSLAEAKTTALKNNSTFVKETNLKQTEITVKEVSTEEESNSTTKEAVQAAAADKVDSSSTKEKTTKTTKKVKASEKTEVKEAKNTAKKTESKVKLSNEDIEVLQRIVEAEATGEDIKGKILVANVILNRVNDEDFPDTVKAVVFQKDGSTYQFSPIKDGRYYSVKVSESTKKAVKRVLEGEDYSRGALYFSARIRADKNSMSWFDRHLTFLFKYGGHEFFK